MTRSGTATQHTGALVRPSRPLLSVFDVYLRWYIGGQFHALRLAHASRFPRSAAPLIVYLNHVSWWDPLTCIMLSRRLLPGADHYAPMDADALSRYGFMRRLGLFPIEMGTARGAAQFLRTAKEILAQPDSILWITPEGRFTDVRARPVAFRPGLAALVSHLGPCTLVPLAVEYTFWNERLPEILALCGSPVVVGDGSSRAAPAWNDVLTSAMSCAQDELAALAVSRDPAQFETILDGRAGVAPVYNGWRRLRSFISGQPYQPEHGSVPRA